MAEQFVYFIQAGEGGPIKIGTAISPEKRLKQHQTSSHDTLVLLGVRPGDCGLEAELHHRFCEHRLRGEWFAPHPAILQEIASSCTRSEKVVAPEQQDANFGLLQVMFVEAVKATFGTDGNWVCRAAASVGTTSAEMADWLSGKSSPADEQIERMEARSHFLKDWALNRRAILKTMDACGITFEFEAALVLFSNPASFKVVNADPDSDETAAYLRALSQRFRARPSILLEGAYGAQFAAMAESARARSIELGEVHA